jgi:N-acetylornithine carbamoyltransferase
MDRTTLRGRDYIETLDWTTEEIDEALALASELKERFKRGEPHRLLPDRTLFMLFLDKSTRTRNAFEAGMTQLGGLAIRHDLVPHEGNAYMREVAKWADIPVINLQCDLDHPTQTLADLMTLREKRGTDLRGLRVAVSWAYAPSYAKPLSVAQGLLTLLPRFGIDVVLAHPPGFELMPEVVERAKAAAAQGGGTITVADDMESAFEGVDVVYPKSWGRLDLFTDEEAALADAAKHTGWICDARRMSLAKDDALYMHCLPADRGTEVTDEVIDGPHSVVFQEAENRLHTGKALMALTMAP